MTIERFDALSFVICSDEITAGAVSCDLTNQTIAPNAAAAKKPSSSHVAMLVLGRGWAVAAAVANKARILSLESGVVFTGDPAGNN